MLHNEKLNPNLKKFENYQRDFYSLDKASFYKITDPEIWDFSSAAEVRFQFIPFFLMRAILHKKLTSSPIHILNLPLSSRILMSKFGSSIHLGEIFSGAFFPYLVEKNSTRKLEFYKQFIEEFQFYKEFVNDSYVVCGGGILRNQTTLLKPFMQELFEVFHLEEKKGKLYFRTHKNSYFYPLNQKEDSQIFFVQERETFPLPFHFFYIEFES